MRLRDTSRLGVMEGSGETRFERLSLGGLCYTSRGHGRLVTARPQKPGIKCSVVVLGVDRLRLIFEGLRLRLLLANNHIRSTAAHFANYREFVSRCWQVSMLGALGNWQTNEVWLTGAWEIIWPSGRIAFGVGCSVAMMATDGRSKLKKYS